MKNLKLLIVGIALLGLNSCMDEDKILAIPPSGALVTITPDGAAVFDLNNAAGSIYSGELNDATNNVANYELSANVYYKASASVSASTVIYSASSFPSRFEISAAEVLSQLGVPQSAVTPGDLVEFRATITTDDGRVFDASTLNGDAAGEALIGAYSWDVPFFCEFQDSAAAGTYVMTLVSKPSYFNETYDRDLASPRTITATSSGGVVTFQDAFGEGDDLVVTMDLATSQATSAVTGSLAPAMDYLADYTNPYLTLRSATYFFSCTGQVAFQLAQCVDQGCFSSGSDRYITLVKQ